MKKMKPLIMIVDDAAFMRRVIMNALIPGGFDRFVEVEDGEKALDAYRKNRPALVLLDITMPKRSGLEVLDDILGEDPQAKVIMCTAVGQDMVITQAISRGARDFIIKPFKKEVLLKIVEASL